MWDFLWEGLNRFPPGMAKGGGLITNCSLFLGQGGTPIFFNAFLGKILKGWFGVKKIGKGIYWSGIFFRGGFLSLFQYLLLDIEEGP